MFWHFSSQLIYSLKLAGEINDPVTRRRQLADTPASRENDKKFIQIIWKGRRGQPSITDGGQWGRITKEKDICYRRGATRRRERTGIGVDSQEGEQQEDGRQTAGSNCRRTRLMHGQLLKTMIGP